jgi:ribose 5-phosphate isomerase RpiB
MQNKVEGLGIDPEEAISIIKIWLDSNFSDEPRHQRRLEKILDKEKTNFK